MNHSSIQGANIMQKIKFTNYFFLIDGKHYMEIFYIFAVQNLSTNT